MSDEIEVLKEVTSRLDETDIPYMISGSVAMNFYAQPRMTRDIDIVVMLELNEVDTFCSLFESDFYVEKESVAEEVRRHGMFNVIHNEYIVKVDFILKKQRLYDDVAFERRKEMRFDGMRMWIISAEDLILYKCLWMKESMSDMQMKDIQNISDMVEDLDWSYINLWAGELGINHVIQKVKHERYA